MEGSKLTPLYYKERDVQAVFLASSRVTLRAKNAAFWLALIVPH